MKKQELKSTKGKLAVDVYQTDKEFCIRAAIGGVDLKDIKIATENCILIIKGEREEPNANEEKDYYYKECHFGPFERQVILPDDTNTSKIKKSLDDGILLIKLQRIPAQTE